jgi:stage II sporulation protein AA (anti-sigma F factor antagonist)
MKIKYNLDKNTLNIYLIGELDECTASKVKEAIDGLIENVNGVLKVVFNLSGLTFMDSTGIGMLIGRYKKLKAKSISVFIESPTLAIEKVLQVSGLYRIMPKI